MSEPVAEEPPLPPLPRPGWVGPLFAWELMRLNRRGHDARARTIVAVVLLLTLFVFLLAWFPGVGLGKLLFGEQQILEVNQTTRFAENFSLAMIFAQMGAMVLLAPVYAAGSLAEEKERKTYPFLITSLLSNREIVLGKFLARLVFLWAVMFAGLPILALTGLVGGVDAVYLLIAYAITAGAVAVLTAAGILAGVLASTFRGAMFQVYGLTALYTFLGCGLHPILSPFSGLFLTWRARQEGAWYSVGLAAIYVLLQLIGTVVFLVFATKRIRLIVERRTPPAFPPGTAMPGAMLTPILPANRVVVLQSPTTLVNPVWRPPVDEINPLLWKEKYTRGVQETVDDESMRTLFRMAAILAGIVLALFTISTVLTLLNNPGSGNGSTIAMIAGCGALFIQLLSIGSSACGAICRERNGRTLESLQSLPLERQEILDAKWHVAVRRGRWWGLPSVLLPLGVAWAGFPLTGLTTAFFIPGLILFATAFGLWLSIRCLAMTRAMMLEMGTLGCLLFTPFILTWVFATQGDPVAAPVMFALAVAVWLGTRLFLRWASRDFEADGR